MSEVVPCEVVELDYTDLVAGVDLTAEIQRAFGVDGVGLLTVKNVPNYVEARSELLPLSRKFADLPEDTKEKYVHKESYYSFGWSHGKEKLQRKPDYSKGSFYANPQYDKPVDDEDIIAKHSSFVHPNIWPKEDLPELEFAFKKVGQIIVSVGKLVAQQCDKFVKSKCETYPDRMLETTIDTSLCCKARLLHYFPMDAEAVAGMESNGGGENENEFSSWCGWHNDHGSLTGLTSAMYIDSSGNIIENTDKSAGKCKSYSFSTAILSNTYAVYSLFSPRSVRTHQEERVDPRWHPPGQHRLPDRRDRPGALWGLAAGKLILLV